MTSVTVRDLTVPAMLRDLGRGAWWAGYIPDTLGIDFSISAKPGADAVIDCGDGTRLAGRVTHADPEDFSIWVQVTGEAS